MQLMIKRRVYNILGKSVLHVLLIPAFAGMIALPRLPFRQACPYLMLGPQAATRNPGFCYASEGVDVAQGVSTKRTVKPVNLINREPTSESGAGVTG